MPEESMRPRPTHNPEVERQEIAFSHPSEEELARILDFYCIPWRYEPMTFPLRWNDRGVVLEAFSPDFYLIDQDLYVELTTLRPKLIRAKQHKVRRLKELYPEVNIRLWRRKDFVRLLERFGLEKRRPALVGKEAVESQHVE